MTSRCEDLVKTIALNTSCESASIICKHMGIQTSNDLGPFGITINAVAPGTILSGERIRSYWDQRTPEDIQKHLSNVPVRRFGASEDVAYAVLFLCDERASFITGAILDVNGGAWVG